MNNYKTKKKDLYRSTMSIIWAIRSNVDFINYSGGGIEAGTLEKQAVILALNRGIVFVAAAGNERADLNELKYYPALYDERIVVVANGSSEALRAATSNFGPQVDYWVPGNNIKSINSIMSGTSMSTAIVSGRLINDRNIMCHGK